MGGPPSPESLALKKGMAQQHLKYFADSFPLVQHRPSMASLPSETMAWRNLGPSKGSGYGAASDIDSGRLAPQGLAVSQDGTTLYLASACGGLWKTTTAHLPDTAWTWTPLTDALAVGSASGNIPVGSLALSPNGTVFIGMGDFSASSAMGFCRSANGGATWSETSQANQQQLGHSSYISFIFPVSDSIILAGCSNGLFRSTDGGATFGATWPGNRVLGGMGSANDFVWSVDQVGPSTQNLVASMNDNATNAGKAYYSSDGGATWAPATISGVTTANIGRLTLRSNKAPGNTTVYGIAHDKSTGGARSFFTGLFKSTDGGQSYSFVADLSGQFTGGQAEYNQCLAVKPTEANTNTVFVGANLGVYRTTDGGAHFTRLTFWYMDGSHAYSHADNHCSAWSPDGATLYIGNDGGLAVFRDPYRAIPPSGPDTTFVDNRHNENISSHLVYHLGSTNAPTPPASGKTPAQVISIGLQDNSARIRVGTPIGASREFEDTTFCGDGFATLVHPLNADLILTSGYYCSVNKATDGGVTSSSWHGANFYTGASLDTLSSANSPFHTRLAPGWADATGNTVYCASSSKLYVSTDFGSTFHACAMGGFTDSIRNFNSAKSDGNTLAIVGANKLWLSTDAGATWTWTSSLGAGVSFPVNGYPNNLGYVWFDTTNKNIIYLADVSSGYGFTYQHLWRSADGGATFANIEGNGFPSGFSGSGTFGGPVHIIQNDPTTPTTLLAGTDFGVYISTNSGATWSRYGTGLPMVGARDLYIAPDASFVRIATYGRGVWEIGSPTLIVLNNFKAALADGKLQLVWVTASELQTAGFHLWRSDAFDGSFTRITPALLPSTGDPLSGASYTYLDTGATALGPYFYKLEEIDFKGASTFYGPIKADFRPGQSILYQTGGQSF